MSSYDAVKAVELQYLTDNWDEVSKTAGYTAEMDNVVKGIYPHAGQLLAEIIQNVRGKLDAVTTRKESAK